MSAIGRLLGVDYGTVRVGLAVCDSEHIIASPLLIYTRRDPATDAAFFCELVKSEEIAGLVVGLPVHMSGDEGGKAKEARAYGDWLAQLTGLPVAYFDERYTTADAEAHLLDAGLSKKKRKNRLDKVAAQIILQSYLEVERHQAPKNIDDSQKD